MKATRESTVADLQKQKNLEQLSPSKHRKNKVGLAAVNRKWAIASLVPVVGLLFAFLAIPAMYSIWLSFNKWPGIGTPEFVGTQNYETLFEEGRLAESIRITLLYTFIASFLIVGIALLLAFAVSSNMKGSRFFRVVWFFPGVAPPAAVAIFWSLGFQPEIGVVNSVMGFIGLPSDTQWLAESATVMGPVIFAGVWIGVGFAFLVLLGAVEGIDVSLREASVIDGASRRQQLTHIIIPLIGPVLFTILTLQLIWNFNGFNLVYAMTEGGPGRSSEILPIFTYVEAFRFGRFGTASAAAVIAGIFLLILGFLGIRLSRSRQLD
jgi:ABC-type sugar transport system permease subunit